MLLLQLGLSIPIPLHVIQVLMPIPAPGIYCVEAHIIKLPFSELAPEKSRDAPDVVAQHRRVRSEDPKLS